MPCTSGNAPIDAWPRPRNCPHLPTSQALEALGVELMEKAAELEELSDNEAQWDA
jgi:hypothetical protein